MKFYSTSVYIIYFFEIIIMIIDILEETIIFPIILFGCFI